MRKIITMAVLAAMLPAGNASATDKAERERRMRLNYEYARQMWWGSAGQISTTIGAPPASDATPPISATFGQPVKGAIKQ